MNARKTFEAQLADLIAGYADAAPIDVDPLATARFARAAASRRKVADWFTWVDRTLAVGLGIVLLMVTFIAGATVGGRGDAEPTPQASNSSPAPVPRFSGLPPAEAVPSSPMMGVLVASSFHIHPYFAVFAYEDGRLISSRDVPGLRWTTMGWREQHLSPEGVELLRAGAVALPDWDELDATSWLPSNGWDDAHLSAYVPARYAVCVFYDADNSPPPVAILDRLSVEARALLDNALRVYDTPGGGRPGPMRCHDLTLRDAQALDEILAETFATSLPAVGLAVDYRLDDRGNEFLTFLPLLPHGVWSPEGGG
jgi:hypothetical protein